MIIKSIKIRGFNLERVWRESSPSFETNSYSNERIDVTFGEKKKRDLQFSCKQSREGVRNKLDNRCFLPSTQKAWHSSLYFSSTTSPQSFSRFSTIPPFPSILFTTRLLLFHLSRLVSLKFPSGLQQPFLHFFPLRSRYISLFFPVFLLLFFPSATTLPFYFFFLLIFLRRGLCFRPPSLPLHFWPVTGLIRDFDAETWKSSIETNRLRGATVCGGIGVCVCNTNEIK